MALAFETTYGTAPPAGSYWKMPFASSTLGAEQPLLASELLGYGRDPIAPVKDAITADGDVTVPIDARFLGIWLKALLGAPTTTGAAAPYSHEFRSGEWDLPSMAIEVAMPEVPHFAMTTGVKANQLSWQMQRSGLVTATMGLIARGESVGAASIVGNPVEMPLLRFGAFAGSVARDGAQLGNIVSARITYANNLDRIETIRDDGMIDGADPAMAALTGTIDVRFADQALMDQAIDGAASELEFGYRIDAATSFTLTAHAVYLPRPRVPLQGPGGVQASFAWQAARDAGLGRMVTATLVNDVPDYANPA
jgi:hypothetical protein